MAKKVAVKVVRKVIKKRSRRIPAAASGRDHAAAMLSKLTLASKALVELYPQDATAPGLVLAWIPKRQEFYASFARYQDGEKVVLTKAYGDTLHGAVDALVSAWREATKNARQMAEVG